MTKLQPYVWEKLIVHSRGSAVTPQQIAFELPDHSLAIAESTTDIDQFGAVPHGVKRLRTWEEWVSIARARSIDDRRSLREVSAESFRALLFSVDQGGELRASYLDQGATQLGDFIFADNSKLSVADMEYMNRILASTTIVGGVVTKKNDKEFLVVAKNLEDCGALTVNGVESTSYARVRPEIIGPANVTVNLEKITHHFSEQYVAPGQIAFLRDALVTGYGQVVVENSIVEESFVHSFHLKNRVSYFHVDGSLYSTPMKLFVTDQEHRISEPCVILKQTWDANYGHWLVDTFARLVALGEQFDYSRLKYLVNTPSTEAMKQVFIDSMALLGVAEDQLIFSSTHTWLLEKGIYLTPITKAPLVKHPRTIEFLRSLVPQAKQLGGINHASDGKIYLSRNKTGKRMLENEDEIFQLFEHDGFVKIYPEQLSLFDQIVTFGSALKVTGSMGAAFTNLVFSPEGVSACCLATESMFHDYFYDIVCLKKGTYYGVQGKATQPNLGVASNFEIEQKTLEKFLAEVNFL